LKPPTRGFEAELLIECRDASIAAALNKVLMPDNRYFPKDQRFLASKNGAVVRFKVESPRLRPAISTMSSIVSDSKLFRDVWVESKARSRPL
jgi:hypothetical protein